LRAIAIIPVVIFHAFPSLMPGGFVGVDIFFVISGFLISGIILKGLQRDSASLLFTRIVLSESFLRYSSSWLPASYLAGSSCFPASLRN
jgi:peptidoglycan/LPS O-acetylase OafA/YrhL